MKKSIFLLLILLLTGCATFQVSILNHDPVRVVNNKFELQRLLRTDFNFRFDYAQYALRQPRSFDWNNRILGNRYNRYNPYYGYSPYWNRDQMWNDWLWGYPFNNGIGFTYNWRNRRWSSNQGGWNNYYSWNYHYPVNRRTNISNKNTTRRLTVNNRRTPITNTRTRSTITRQQTPKRITVRSTRSNTRPTTIPPITRSTVKSSTTRNTTRSTPKRRGNINRKN